jgi:hypothetical protein
MSSPLACKLSPNRRLGAPFLWPQLPFMVLQAAQKPELVRTDASNRHEASASGCAVTASFQTGADLFDERISMILYCKTLVGEIVMTGITRTGRRKAVAHPSGRTAPAKPITVNADGAHNRPRKRFWWRSAERK